MRVIGINVDLFYLMIPKYEGIFVNIFLLLNIDKSVIMLYNYICKQIILLLRRVNTMKKSKKISLSADYLTTLSRADLTTYHYKILMLLAVHEMTQTQIADFLQTQKQNVNKYVSDLIKLNLLEVARIEGKNKFLKATNTFEQTISKDQMKLTEE